MRLLILILGLSLFSCTDKRDYYKDIDTGKLYMLRSTVEADTVILRVVPELPHRTKVWGIYNGKLPEDSEYLVFNEDKYVSFESYFIAAEKLP